MTIHRQVKRMHFEDYSGVEFERLVFAYHLRTCKLQSLEWYGQVGSDLGRDIWGVLETDYGNQSVCVQCVNRMNLTVTKAKRDIASVLSAPNGKPDIFRFVCGGNVSAQTRDKVKDYASSHAIYRCDIWSGQEFEELLRTHTESLLLRFCEGVAFPDAAPELETFITSISPADDEERFALVAQVFNRPAFYTPFYGESNLPAFKQAIGDTIQALNTGIWQTRDGKVISRLPSIADFDSKKAQEMLNEIVHDLVMLRMTFDSLRRAGEIHSCGCNNPDCGIYTLSPKACREMDRLRTDVLDKFRGFHPKFNINVEQW